MTPTQKEREPHHECYALIEVSEDGEESSTFYSSRAARDDATLKAIWFDGPDECHKEEAAAYLDELREKGILTFEGDPPLKWLTMVPAARPEAPEQGEVSAHDAPFLVMVRRRDDKIAALEAENFKLKNEVGGLLSELPTAADVERIESLKAELEKVKEENRILAINGNNDEARCVEIGMLQEEVATLKAERDRLQTQVQMLTSDPRTKQTLADFHGLDARGKELIMELTETLLKLQRAALAAPVN